MLQNLIEKTDIPKIESYWELFITTGWNANYKFTKSELEIALNNSWKSISIYDNEKLVGFGRILGDGVHHAFIVDLIVHPSYQSRGIGRHIMKKLIDLCKLNSIRDIQLFAAMDKFSFYQKLGFEKRKENAPGMQYVFNKQGFD